VVRVCLLGWSRYRGGIAEIGHCGDYRFHMARQCTRQGCVHPATVTLTYQYARSQVWLDNLSPERDPHSYDMCDQHANRLTPPSGWHLEDRRQRVHIYGAGRLAG
jgi:hypothetical protein